MASAPTTTFRIDPKIKQDANAVFEELGITMSVAVNAFLKAVVREGGLPFDMRINTTEGPTHSSQKRHESDKKDPAIIKPPVGNASLNHAFLQKKDEFYTQYEDIEKELAYYPSQFTDKTVLCNCDDPFESAFFRYFILHFEELGLKKLISTCYAESSLAGLEYPLDFGTTTSHQPYRAEVTQVPEPAELLRPDNSLDVEALFALDGNMLNLLQGDGDFRSDECQRLLDQADIVVTNPPFSLFREYIKQLEQYNKKYIILGNINAATYKELFPLFRDDKIWYGESIRSGDRKFYVPDDYPLNASGCGVDENGRRFIRVKGVRWFTNVDNGRRHEPLRLTESYSVDAYPKYDNYDVIDVSRTARIPADYMGIMGVPITFLDKYCPEQFQILMLANGNARTSIDPQILAEAGYTPHPDDRGGVGMLNGKRAYARIFIRRRVS